MTIIKSLAAALVLALVSISPVFAASLDEMAGQMIVVGFQGNSVSDKSVVALRDEIAKGRIGGVMFLKTNVSSLAAVKAMNAAFRDASPALPPFITLDQEGGTVERLTKDVGFAEIDTAERIAASNSPDVAERIYAGMAKSIADLGFTVNFGPVVDLNVNPDNQVIAKFGRAYSKDPSIVSLYAAAFIKAHQAAGVLTALKHFPGHGSSTKDSHEGFVDISKTWNPVELEPYKNLFAAGYREFVMVGHLYHADYSGDGSAQLPASLSPDWIDGVLRKDLGFTGVVVSDDLEMGAIRKQFDLKQTVTRAVRAGVDVLLFSNTAQYHAGLGDEIHDILMAEAKADPTFAARIEESYNRIVAIKAQIGK